MNIPQFIHSNADGHVFPYALGITIYTHTYVYIHIHTHRHIYMCIYIFSHVFWYLHFYRACTRCGIIGHRVCVVVPHYGFIICIYLITSEVEPAFVCLLASGFLVKSVLQISSYGVCHFLVAL